MGQDGEVCSLWYPGRPSDILIFVAAKMMKFRTLRRVRLPGGGEEATRTSTPPAVLHRGQPVSDDAGILTKLLKTYDLPKTLFKAVFPNAGPMDEGRGDDKEEFRHPVPSFSTNFL
ncbi:hypothetical protein TNCV_3097591 [Trichonephila clavipes]|nr:hypothetical protein TNCV_3097591 [Trichonephila clavipes]